MSKTIQFGFRRNGKITMSKKKGYRLRLTYSPDGKIEKVERLARDDSVVITLTAKEMSKELTDAQRKLIDDGVFVLNPFVQLKRLVERVNQSELLIAVS